MKRARLTRRAPFLRELRLQTLLGREPITVAHVACVREPEPLHTRNSRR
jgi:hypothetical protein